MGKKQVCCQAAYFPSALVIVGWWREVETLFSRLEGESVARMCTGQHCHVPNHEFQVLQGFGLSCVSKMFCPLTPWSGQGGKWPTFKQFEGWRAGLGCSCSRTLFLAFLYLNTHVGHAKLAELALTSRKQTGFAVMT